MSLVGKWGRPSSLCRSHAQAIAVEKHRIACRALVEESALLLHQSTKALAYHHPAKTAEASSGWKSGGLQVAGRDGG